MLRRLFLLAALCSGPAYASGFTDLTAQAGIRFRHVNGAFVKPDGTDSRYMPETMGAGVAVFDYDGDGDQDLLFVNSAYFQPGRKPAPPSALYENLGGWRFKDVTRQAGLNQAFYGMGAVAADYDGDGDADLLFTGLGGLRLYRNNGRGRFAEATRQTGLHPVHWTDGKGRSGPEWPTAALLFDADGDGDLDILSAQYVRWSPETDIATTYDTVHKGYTTPRAYDGQSLRLWRQAHGRFYDATAGSGLAVEGKGLGLALWDFDADGRLDVAVANDTTANFLFHNLGGGRFEEIGLKAGVAYGPDGRPRGGMGIDIADYRNDGGAAIAIGNFAEEPTSLFRMVKPWQFREDSAETGVAAPTLPLLTFGLVFADVDLDGWQDLITANGHIEPAIRAVMPMQAYPQPLQWLRNLGDGRFAEAGLDSEALRRPMVGRGLAVADLDGDGDLDLVASSNNGPPRLLRNDLNPPRWLRVALRGLPPNTDAIGAQIVLHGSRRTQRRYVRTGGSYLSQSELPQTFGLAAGETVARLEVAWPGGAACTLARPASNRSHLIRQSVKTSNRSSPRGCLADR